MTGFRDVTFDPKGVDAIIKTNIKRNFDGVTYDSSKNEERTSALVNDCVKGLQSLNIPFKFAVNAIVVQNVSAGLATSAGFYWDSAKDGTSCVVPSLSYSPFVSFVHTISLADIYVGILSIVCVRQDSQRPNGRTSTTRLLSPFLPWASNHTRIRFGDEWGGGSNRCVANEQTSKNPKIFAPKKNSSHDAPTDSPILHNILRTTPRQARFSRYNAPLAYGSLSQNSPILPSVITPKALPVILPSERTPYLRAGTTNGCPIWIFRASEILAGIKTIFHTG